MSVSVCFGSGAAQSADTDNRYCHCHSNCNSQFSSCRRRPGPSLVVVCARAANLVSQTEWHFAVLNLHQQQQPWHWHRRQLQRITRHSNCCSSGSDAYAGRQAATQSASCSNSPQQQQQLSILSPIDLSLRCVARTTQWPLAVQCVLQVSFGWQLFVDCHWYCTSALCKWRRRKKRAEERKERGKRQCELTRAFWPNTCASASVINWLPLPMIVITVMMSLSARLLPLHFLLTFFSCLSLLRASLWFSGGGGGDDGDVSPVHWKQSLSLIIAY